MRKIKVGLDFDGVVAYYPLRIVRAPIKWFKSEILGMKKLSFFIPKNNWQKILWLAIFETNIFPARGVELLKEMASSSTCEFYLITARFDFLKESLDRWLKREHLTECFKQICVNGDQQQPHEFKEAVINKLKLDYYVEDNFDIVSHLTRRTKTKIYWIYNIFDKNKSFPNKYPYLEKALEAIS